MNYTRFKLKENPFRLTPDPRFLHLAEPHREVLYAVLRCIAYRKGFMVATGPIGTGKTTLIHAAMRVLTKRLLPGDKLLSAIIVDPLLSREEFLETLLQEFEISCQGATKPQRLLALRQALLAKQAIGGTAVLFVDEAHLLSPDLLQEIRLLSNADSYSEKILQVILSGQPELEEVLSDPVHSALRQRVWMHARLRELTLAETRAYMAERLHAAGLQGESPFSSDAVQMIHNFSEGIPRLINLLADCCLAVAHESEVWVVREQTVEFAASTVGMGSLAESPSLSVVRSLAASEHALELARRVAAGRSVRGTDEPASANGSPIEIQGRALRAGRGADRS